MALPLRRAKSGRIKESHDSPELVQKFDGIRDRLLLIAKDGHHDYGLIKSSDLSKLWIDLQHFMEDTFGVTAKEQGREWVMTRLPAKLFRDFHPKGSLATIMKAAFDYKETLKWRAFNLESKGKREENVDMFLSIERALQEDGFLEWPQIYFSASVPSHLIPNLKRQAEQHAATVVDKIEDSTHVVIYDQEVDKETAEFEQDFLRSLETRRDKGMSLVHWWYYPDSYDEWIPNNEVEGEADDAQAKPPYYVNCRYIRDVDKYNEWGNEIDYEVGEELVANVTKNEGRPIIKKPIVPVKKKPSTSGNGGHASATSSGGESHAPSHSHSQPPLAIKKKSGGGLVVIPPAQPSPTTGGEKKHESTTLLVGVDGKTGKVATKFKIVTKEHKPPSDSHEAKKTSFNISKKRPAEVSGGDGSDNEPLLPSPPSKKGRPPLGKEGASHRKKSVEEGSGGMSSSSPADKGLNLKLRIKRPDSLDGQAKGKKRTKTEADLKKAKARRDASVPEFANVHEVKGNDMNEISRPTEDLSREALIGDMGGNTVRLYKGPQISTDSFDDGITSGLSDTESMFTKKEEPPPILELPIPTLNLPHRTVPKRARPLPHMASQFNTFFDESTIHPIEMRCLPEFFTGRSTYNKTPETYMVYRQFMIREYESSPSEYLSFTDCRRKLAGDAGTILRVHQFLDQWGIINGQVPEEQRPAYSLRRFVGTPTTPWATNLGVNQEVPSKKPGSIKDGNVWTESEIQSLVKAVMSRQDDWNGVAAEVGSKDAEQCVLKLLSLPLEDKTLAVLGEQKGMNPQSGGPAPPGSSASNTSASSSSNLDRRPALIKDLGSILAQQVHPQVVKAAMSAAWQEVLSLKSQLVSSYTDTPPTTQDAMGPLKVKLPESLQGKLNMKTEVKEEVPSSGTPTAPSNGQKEGMEVSPTKDGDKDKGSSAVAMDVDGSETKPSTVPGTAVKPEEITEVEKKASDVVGTMEELRQASSAAVLSLIGLQAKALAEEEEKSIQQLLQHLLEVKLRKVELKVQHVDEIEKLLEAERLALVHEREEVFLQRSRNI